MSKPRVSNDELRAIVARQRAAKRAAAAARISKATKPATRFSQAQIDQYN